MLARTNGQPLVTRLDTPILEQIDASGAVLPIVMNAFPPTYAECLGITETTKDIFYVVVQAPSMEATTPFLRWT